MKSDPVHPNETSTQDRPNRDANKNSGMLTSLLAILTKPETLYIVLLTVAILITRFVNLDKGLPYTIHPDERNMAWAVMDLTCPDITDPETCLKPDFFAYGQLPLYSAMGLVHLKHAIMGEPFTSISYAEATMALRYISAFAGTALIIITALIACLLLRQVVLPATGVRISPHIVYPPLFLLVFAPGIMQLSRFGTTEAFLMMSLAALVYLGLLLQFKKINLPVFVVISGIVAGAAIASKVSAAPFLIAPGLSLLLVMATRVREIHSQTMHHIQPTKTEDTRTSKHRLDRKSKSDSAIQGVISVTIAGILLLIITAGVAGALSPHNLISYPEFRGSLQYESSVGLGDLKVFYTRQFEDTIPVLFQLDYVLPFVFGLPLLVLILASLIFVRWTPATTYVRLVLLVNFLIQSFVYTKWTRFPSPVYPLLVVMAIVMLWQLIYAIRARAAKPKTKTLQSILQAPVLVIFTFFLALPGIAFTGVFIQPDVRFTASVWMYQNIPEGSRIFAEAGNDIEVPVKPPFWPDGQPTPLFEYRNFDFYNLDQNPMLPDQLRQEVSQADYIVSGSRRAFYNTTCIRPPSFESTNQPRGIIEVDQRTYIHNLFASRAEICKERAAVYPETAQYYGQLFSGELGFEQIAKITAYPEIRLFGVTLIRYPDEAAEETWTVFDHPVVRVWKRRDGGDDL